MCSIAFYQILICSLKNQGSKPRSGAETETDEPDRFEWFNLGQDSLMGLSPAAAPAARTLPPGALHLVLEVLPKHRRHNRLRQRDPARPAETLASLQESTKPSAAVPRLTKAFASPGKEDLRTSMINHPDFGTITLLANVLGGLQILAP